jgi:hypothetical protein
VEGGFPTPNPTDDDVGTGIAPVLTEQNLEPMMTTTSGNITIDIPDYDPSIGWIAGPTNTKEATITVNF